MKTIFITILLLTSAWTLQADNRPLLETKEKIIRQATIDLDQATTAPEGVLYKIAKKYNIKGSYTFQLTIRDKGDIVSVFVVSQEEGTIASQNRLKDAVFDYRLSFKMPKNKDYKLNYTFKF